MARYCKECGHHIEFQYGEPKGYCPICSKEIELKDTISDYTLNARIAQLKAMHQLMAIANDEYIYFTWIATFPDEPNEDDFTWVAMKDEEYNECFDEFVRLIAYKGNRY